MKSCLLEGFLASAKPMHSVYKLYLTFMVSYDWTFSIRLAVEVKLGLRPPNYTLES